MTSHSAIIALTCLCTGFWSSGRLEAMAKKPPMQSAASGRSQGQIRFFTQAVVFRGEGGAGRVDISYSLSYNQVQFVADGSGFRSSFTILAMVTDNKGRQVAGDSWDKSHRVREYAGANSEDSLMIDTLRLAVKPGRYRLKVICKDNNSERSGEYQSALTVPEPGPGPALSGLRFERLHDLTQSIVPWPNHRYGDAAPRLVCYFQVYSPSADSFVLLSRIRREGDARPAWSKTDTILVDRISDSRLRIAVDTLPNGSYEVSVTLLRLNGDSLDCRRDVVAVLNARLTTSRGYNARIDQLNSIARTRELDTLRRAGQAERDSLWQRFWDSRDPTPGTPGTSSRRTITTASITPTSITAPGSSPAGRPIRAASTSSTATRTRWSAIPSTLNTRPTKSGTTINGT